ncbi:MAG: hypothetical protein H0T42_16365 [Deltaproteobacteria bacterium]|nr:hypothetical protein [Deltaproteobacteria bacterium]
MTTVFQPGVFTATHTYLTHLIAYGLGCGLIGASLMFAAKPPAVVQGPPTIELTETVSVPTTMPRTVTTDEMPAAPAVWVVITAGTRSYIKLSDGGTVLPRHGKPKLFEHDWVSTSIAPVADADVPPVHRARKGTEVIVDGTCRATITGFAVVARLSGDTAYASEEDTWSAASVMRLGAPVLAARLDGCTGELARSASLSPMIVPEVIEDKRLVAAAKKQLYASADMKTARREWAAWEAEMQPSQHQELDLGELSTKVVRHPKTGATFVSIHATTSGACGSPNISLWGLYRADDAGTLTRIPTEVGELIVIDGFVDLEGDGELEVVGRPWLDTERMVARTDGEVIERLERPFYGCAC